ncbi:TfoX/Sxy family protein [Cohaesibacter intestini]|uniref:TfoX/Sxy family protein n=1 Tax=Cohaesibacter intestini TaxID=2211145 RepID=UPI000DEA74F9|nr:RNA methyltransferase [Cohaesibacter intestini]
MAFDEVDAHRLRDVVAELPDVTEVKMMGGLCFLTAGNMIGGTHIDKSGTRVFMFRVGKKNMMEALARPGASTLISGSRPMTGFVRVDADDCSQDELIGWIALTMRFVGDLPPKDKE